jgi:hypothetical protein
LPQKLECAEIIEAGDVIVMLVRVEHSFKMCDTVGKHLLAKIRARVYHDVILSVLDEDTDAQAFIAWVGGSAHFAPTANHRYSNRCASAKKCDLHLNLGGFSRRF